MSASAASSSTELLAQHIETAGLEHAHALHSAATHFTGIAGHYTGLGASLGAALLHNALGLMGLRVRWAPAAARTEHSSSSSSALFAPAPKRGDGTPMGLQVEYDDHVLYALGMTLLIYFMAYLYVWLPPLLHDAVQPT